MTPFLKQVADHFFDKSGLENVCFIFPNRRSISFFKKYLAERVKAVSDTPVVAPMTLTVNDFFFEMAGRGQCDRITLILKLYDCYRQLNPAAEKLDDFLFWGDILLSDFDDVDKYLVNAAQLFRNVSEFKDISDSFEYLSDAQRDAISRFIQHFEKGGAIKTSFLQIWNILAPLYTNFREVLDGQDLAYEGQAYRYFAENEKAVADSLQERFPNVSRYIFTGLNALNECEKSVMKKMKRAGLAEFCWDWSSPMIRDDNNKSSFFMKENVATFGQAFDIDPEGLPQTEFNTIGVPSSSGQTRLIPEILSSLPATAGIETALVLPDETLLLPALNVIPPSVQKLNVTMGHPMGGSALWTLMTDIAGLQMHLRNKDGKWWFYHKQVWSIFSNSIFRTIADDGTKEAVARIKKNARHYIPQDEICSTPLLQCIFRPTVTDTANCDGSMVLAIEEYQLRLLGFIAPLLKGAGNMQQELDFAREYWLQITRLKNTPLPIIPATYFSLLNSIMNGTSIPFEGEPLNGMQIMGPLETRALDFENLIIFSCNEGSFPRRSVSSSFIPAELRKGFGLPTYEFQDAVWAYYFYRMIQRASRVWMLYNTSCGGMRSGEESRYIKQLELHFDVKINRMTATAPIATAAEDDDPVKTEAHIATLKQTNLSASALKSYLCCPAQFYYSKVCGLREVEEVNETLDRSMLGNVFHECMEEIYKDRVTADAGYIRQVMEKRDALKSLVERKIREKIKSCEISGRNIIYRNIILRYIHQTLKCDLELIGNSGAFRFFGIEKKFTAKIGGYNFVGYVDRLDSINDSEIRIVDYKTGKVSDNDFLIDDANAEDIVEKLFAEDSEDRPDIALQLFLYDRFIEDFSEAKGRTRINSIYHLGRLFTEGVKGVKVSDKFLNLMTDRLDALLEEISDTSRPWSRKGDEKTCSWCDFKNICGR